MDIPVTDGNGNGRLRNLLLIGTLVVTLASNGLQWVKGQGRNEQANIDALAQMSSKIDALAVKVQSLEDAKNDLKNAVGDETGQRKAMEPRIKAIEDKSNDTNMMVRRLLERYRVPGY